MDMRAIRAKVTLLAFGSPAVLLPALAGGTCLALTIAMQLPPIFGLASIIALCVGLGTGVTRRLAPSERLVQTAIAELQNELIEARNSALDELYQRLDADNDPRTEVLLNRLRELIDQFRQPALVGHVPSYALVELQQRAEQLFDAGVQQLEKSLALYHAAQRVSGSARRKFADDRERLLQDIDQTIIALADGLTKLHRLGTTSTVAVDTAALRTEFDASLRIAADIEARMKESLGEEDPSQQERRKRYRRTAQ